jgi:hypothetical protein
MQAGDQLRTTRIYDEENGLGIEWVRDEPPMERRSHFRLLVGDREIPFSASVEFGSDRAMGENPDMSFDDLLSSISSNRALVLTAQNIDADFDPDIFLQIWHELLSRDRPNTSVGVVYSETKKAGGPRLEWSKGV